MKYTRVILTIIILLLTINGCTPKQAEKTEITSASTEAAINSENEKETFAKKETAIKEENQREEQPTDEHKTVKNEEDKKENSAQETEEKEQPGNSDEEDKVKETIDLSGIDLGEQPENSLGIG